MTNEEIEAIIHDLQALSERNNLNKQHKESCIKAISLLRPMIEETTMPEPQEEKRDENTVTVDLSIPGLPIQIMELDKYSAMQLVEKFRHSNPPVFACNLPGGGLWEVDLQKVASISSDDLEATADEEAEEDREPQRPVPSYKKKERSNGWRRGEVTCHNCGADYEADIHERGTYVRCKYCHESNTTVTYPDE